MTGVKRSFLAVALWLLATGLGPACAPSAVEAVVLPEGFRGPFVIVYDIPGGVAVKAHRDVREYEIPASGILYVSTSRPRGWGARVYIREGTTRREIPVGPKDRDGELQAYEAYEYQVHTGVAMGPGIHVTSAIVGVPAEQDLEEMLAARDQLKTTALRESSQRLGSRSSPGMVPRGPAPGPLTKQDLDDLKELRKAVQDIKEEVRRLDDPEGE